MPKFSEKSGFVDEGEATIIALIERNKIRYRKSNYWKRLYNKEYPKLSKNGKVLCDKLLEKIY